MKFYCYETESDFVLCIENADARLNDNIQEAWFKKTETGFSKIYPMKGMDNGVTAADKELIKRNFARLGQSMFEGIFDWENVLSLLAAKFKEYRIEWYIIGSVSEAILGVDIKPHDIDIIVHTKDFWKVKDIFADAIVEPFVDNKGTWIVRYFGRLCLGGALIDIAADDKMNLESNQLPYEKILWHKYDVHIEPLEFRYKTELKRNRADRIKAIEEYKSR